jgi:PAS domain S-box-containing protein
VTGSLTLLTDITESHMAREALQANEERFRTLANAIPQLAWIADSAGSVTWFNRSWYAYVGGELRDWEGWGWVKVLEPESRAAVRGRWFREVEHGTPFEAELAVRGTDQRWRRFRSRMEPLRDSAGRVRQWFGTLNDVEELRRVELELRECQSRWETAHREFSYSLAHDLRGPLRGIDGWSQAVLEEYGDRLDETGRGYLQRVRSEIRRMGQSLDGLLQVSRVSPPEVCSRERDVLVSVAPSARSTDRA